MKQSVDFKTALNRAFERALIANPFVQIPHLGIDLDRVMRRASDYEGPEKNFQKSMKQQDASLSEAFMETFPVIAQATTGMGTLRPFLDLWARISYRAQGHGFLKTALNLNYGLGLILAPICHPDVEFKNPGVSHHYRGILESRLENDRFFKRSLNGDLARGLTEAVAVVSRGGFWPSTAYHREIIRILSEMGRLTDVSAPKHQVLQKS